MNYEESIEYIHSTSKFGSKLGLRNITVLLDLLGNPQESFLSVHVGGTNGKGSTCAYVESVLRHAGFKVGMFISPYLEKFTERIQVNGQQIPEDHLSRITTRVRSMVEKMVSMGHAHPTEFEIVTAIGFCYFKEQKVDIAVVEVGLGGRLDSTNVIQSLVSVITSISYDHMHVLGNSLEQIAYEKAGIIKEGGTVVLYPQEAEAEQVIKRVCHERKARLYDVSQARIEVAKSEIGKQIFSFSYGDYQFNDIMIGMIGRHQIMNAAAALMAIIALKEKGYSIPNDAVFKGFTNSRWPGRFEMMTHDPMIILDGAHNGQGARILCQTVEEYLENKRIILVTGMLQDKEVSKMVKHFAGMATKVIVTTPDGPRAMDPHHLADEFKRYDLSVDVEPDSSKAIRHALALYSPETAIVVAGSLYLVGNVRTILKNLMNLC
ncbi:MAG: bifunctional folylpolyglutamate synthase/dihydrofolate synthase [Clostridia bacterium]